jgi:hypothetical protein
MQSCENDKRKSEINIKHCLSKNEREKDRQTDWQKERETSGQTDERKTDRLAGWLKYTRVDRMDRKRGRWIDRKTDK